MEKYPVIEILDSPRETVRVKTKIIAYTDLSIFFFPNGEPFTEEDYDEIAGVYYGMKKC